MKDAQNGQHVEQMGDESQRANTCGYTEEEEEVQGVVGVV